jgi:hypothetical protein
MADTALTAINKTINAVILIKGEIDSFNKIKEKYLERINCFFEHIKVLKNSIDQLMKVLEDDLFNEHKLKKLIILELNNDIKEFTLDLNDIVAWYKNINNARSSCSLFFRKKTIENLDLPSNIEIKIETTFNKIKSKIPDIIELESKILGSAVKINHPLFKKIWMKLSSDLINQTEVSTDLISQIIFELLLIEHNYNIFDKDYCNKMIREFVEKIDNLAGTPPNNKISVIEINQYPITEENSKDIQSLVGLKEIPQEIITTKLNVQQFTPIKINHTHERTKVNTKLLSYGFDFPNKVIYTFNVPHIDQKFLCLDIEMESYDQGWGGTGQSHVRYTINDSETIVAFFIKRDREVKQEENKNIYNFTISSSDIKINDKIDIYACTPGWSGWAVEIKNIKIEMKTC